MTTKISIKSKSLFKNISKPNLKNTKIIKKDISENKKPNKDFSGVYQIFCTETKRSYIGSSSNVQKRLKTHKQHLEKGCHNSRILQKEYDKYGLDKFEFIILEKDLDISLLTAYEKYWIYKTNAIVKYKGYNEKFPECTYAQLKYIYNLKENNMKE